jgi:hypothetical protein
MEKNQIWKDKSGNSWIVTSVYDNMLGFASCIVAPYGWQGQRKELSEKELLAMKFVGKV